MKITISCYENEPESFRAYSVELHNDCSSSEMEVEFNNLLLCLFPVKGIADDTYQLNRVGG